MTAAAPKVREILTNAGIDPAPRRTGRSSCALRPRRSWRGFFTADLLDGTRAYVLAVAEHATRRVRIPGVTLHVGFQKSATGLDLGFYAARSYSLMRPPRTGRRLIRSRERPVTG